MLEPMKLTPAKNPGGAVSPSRAVRGRRGAGPRRPTSSRRRPRPHPCSRAPPCGASRRSRLTGSPGRSLRPVSGSSPRRDRAHRRHARPLLPVPELTRAPRHRARPRPLEADSRAAGHSAAARCQRVPPDHSRRTRRVASAEVDPQRRRQPRFGERIHLCIVTTTAPRIRALAGAL